jgi:hypothetical protein
MDLTTSFPASVKAELFGIVQLQRTIEKGKALAHGNVGEYHYNCPMDVAVFTFLGIDHEQLLNVIKNAKSDDEINAYVKPFIEKKSAEELATWNKNWLASGPAEGSESYSYFIDLRTQVAPDRTDIKAWADLLDLDEKRPVPVAA